MPYVPHYRVTFSGTLGVVATPAEIFSFGISVAGGTGVFLTQPEMPAFATALAGAWDAVRVRLSNNVRCTRVRVASVGPLGLVVKDASGAYVQGDDVTGRTGAAGSDMFFPPQVSLAVSTLSNFAGPNGRGRFYLPGPASPIGQDLRLSTVDRDGFLSSAKAFVDAINTASAAQSQGRACVASRGSVLKGVPGGNRTITRVGVGKAYDTIRSRRNSLLEQRTELAVA